MPHAFPIPLPVKHNENLKCEITEYWFVLCILSVIFGLLMPKNLPEPNFSLIGSLSEVIKEKCKFKMIFVPIRYFAIFSNSDVSETTWSQELKLSEFSYFNDAYKWCKNEEF